MHTTENTTPQKTLNDPAHDLGQIRGKPAAKTATITWNDEYQEWQVVFYRWGVHQTEADYYTDDREDAYQTAKYWITH